MKTVTATLLMGLTALIADAETRRTYLDDVTSLRDTIVWYDCPPHTTEKVMEIRASLPEARDTQGLCGQSFGIVWQSDASPETFYSVTLTPGNEAYDHIIDSRYMQLDATYLQPGCPAKNLLSRKLKSGVGFEQEENTLSVEIDCISGLAKIFAGNRELLFIDAIETHTTPEAHIGICAQGTADIKLSVKECTTDDCSALISPWDAESISNYFSGADTDELEGYWTYLDRENDERYCRLGGHYTVALIKDHEGGYHIYYVDGARVNSHKWQPGMLKGHLAPTIFDRHYNLTWYDSTFRRHSDETNAQFEQNSIMSLRFPLLDSTIRFSRARRDK